MSAKPSSQLFQPLHTAVQLSTLVAVSSVRQGCDLDMILASAIGFDRCGMMMKLFAGHGSLGFKPLRGVRPSRSMQRES
jgi:hypothetical protein